MIILFLELFCLGFNRNYLHAFKSAVSLSLKCKEASFLFPPMKMACLTFKNSHSRTCLLILERGKEEEREGEKHPCERETLIGCLWYVFPDQESKL